MVTEITNPQDKSFESAAPLVQQVIAPVDTQQLDVLERYISADSRHENPVDVLTALTPWDRGKSMMSVGPDTSEDEQAKGIIQIGQPKVRMDRDLGNLNV